MSRERDIGSLFSRNMTVFEAAEFLRESGVCTFDKSELYDMKFDSLLGDIDSILRHLSYQFSNGGYVEALDYMLRHQIAKTTKDSNADTTLDEFLSTFTIHKTSLEVN